MTGIIAIVKHASAKCHCFVYCPKKKNIRSGRWVEAPVEVSSLSLDNNKVTEFYLHLRRLIWFLFSLTIKTDEKSCLTISIPATVSSVSSIFPPVKVTPGHFSDFLSWTNTRCPSIIIHILVRTTDTFIDATIPYLRTCNPQTINYFCYATILVKKTYWINCIYSEIFLQLIVRTFLS